MVKTLTDTRPLSRHTLADQLAQELLSSVVDGTFSLGQELPSEAQIAATFAVSRAVVREALGHLKAMGVVQVTNGKKASVKLLDTVPLSRFFTLAAAQEPNNLITLLEVRSGIESESAFLAAERRTAEDLEHLLDVAQQMRALVAQRQFDATQYAELDRAFHLAIARASKNTLLEQLALSIREPMRSTILAGLRTHFTPRQRRDMQAGHDAIADAIRQGDSKQAQIAMRSHIMGAARRIMLTSNTQRPHGAADLEGAHQP